MISYYHLNTLKGLNFDIITGPEGLSSSLRHLPAGTSIGNIISQCRRIANSWAEHHTENEVWRCTFGYAYDWRSVREITAYDFPLYVSSLKWASDEFIQLMKGQ